MHEAADAQGTERGPHVSRPARAGRDNRTRTLSKQERYDEILEAAAKVFAQHGYRASTIHDVAAELNLTAAALYHYVEGKQDLLIDICARAGNPLYEAAIEILVRDLPPQEKLRLLFRRHLEVIHTSRAISTILIQERSELPPEHLEKLDAAERAYFATIRTLLEQIAPPGSQPDPRLSAYAMVGMMNWTLRWYHEGGRYDLDHVADAFFRIFVLGFAPGSESEVFGQD